MPISPNLLIVIADGEHVRFVRPAEDNALHTKSLAASFDAHRRSSDLGSDHPGAAFHSDSFAHHALAPRHDLHKLAKEKFAHAVADELNSGADCGAFDELVLVAPSHVLQAVRDALDSTTEAKVIGTLSKDLVKVPDDELWPHVHAWVRPVHRPVI